MWRAAFWVLYTKFARVNHFYQKHKHKHMCETLNQHESNSKSPWRFIFYRVTEIGEIKSNTSKNLRDDMFVVAMVSCCLGSHGAFEDFPWDKIGEKTWNFTDIFSKGKIEVIFNGKKNSFKRIGVFRSTFLAIRGPNVFLTCVQRMEPFGHGAQTAAARLTRCWKTQSEALCGITEDFLHSTLF